jgi:hypothetical protein
MRHDRLILATAVIGTLLINACGPATTPPPSSSQTTIELTSTAFVAGEPIPQTYTCDGADISPPLSWGEPPDGTQSFALIMDDPDAPVGTFVHWIAFNIPAGTSSLPEDVPAQEQIPGGGLQGKNSFRNLGYGGPCPPSGSTHEYVFKLYALDTTLDLEAGANKRSLVNAMEGYILARAELTGEYTRQ